MKLHSKKLISLMLAVVLVLGIFPMAGFAVEGEEPVLTQETPGDLTTDNPSSPSSLPPETPSTLPPQTPAEETPSTLPAEETPSTLPVETPSTLPVETATPTPTPTPTPVPAADVSTLSGEELYQYLLTLDEEALKVALVELTQEQWDSLNGILTEEVAAQWSALLGVQESIPKPESNFSGNVGSVLGTVTTSAAKMRLRSVMVATTYSEPPSLPTPTNDPTLITDKYATAKSDGSFDITIKAYTKSNIQTTKLPLDIVLVLDKSPSMTSDSVYSYQAITGSPNTSRTDYYILVNNSYRSVTYQNSNFGWYYGSGSNKTYIKYKAGGTGTNNEYEFFTITTMTKLAALKNAANGFIDNVFAESKQSRIAIVTYSDSWTNLSSGFVPVDGNHNPSQTNQDYLKALINGISTSGYTNTGLGMQTAKSVLNDDNPPSGTRAKVVILFTDGVPSSNGRDFKTEYADPAISFANDMKNPNNNKFNATIYTIGFFSGTERSDIRVDRLMSYTSSFYPYSGTVLTVNDTLPTDQEGKYYIFTGDPDELQEIFINLSQELTSTIANATVKDVLQRQFMLTTDSRAAIVAAGGVITEDEYHRTVITWTHTFKPVTVVNDVPTPANQQGYFERTFNIVRNPEYIGGNTAETNYRDSGVYNGGTLLETLPLPTVNAELLYGGFTVNNQNIYIGSAVDIAAFFSAGKYTINNVEYSIDGVGNKYVNIVYTLMQGTTELGKYTIPAGVATGSWAGSGTFTGDTITGLTDDADYSVSVTITPIYNGNNPSVGYGDFKVPMAGITLNGSVGVDVYKPVISVKDLAVYLTNLPDLNSAVTGVVWKHNGTDAPGAMGTAPALTYTFTYTSPVTDYPTGDTGVNITSVKRTVIDYPIAAANYTVVNASGVDTAPDFNVYVYKPVVAATDAEVFLGDTTDLSGRYSHDNDTGWYATLGAPAKPATAPGLTLTPALVRGTALPSDITAYAPIMESDFTVNVVANGKTITDKTKFITEEYPLPGGVIGIPAATGGHHFTIRIRTGTLTIQKFGGTDGESYIFTITANNGLTFFEVVQGNNTKAITGLPKGTYTVTEDTNWSWRYNTTAVVYPSGQVIGTVGQTLVTEIRANVTNSDRTPYWLSGESSVANKFKPYNPGA